MAAIHLMPLAACKGRTVGQGIRGIIDCTENPQRDGRRQADYKLAMRQQDRRCQSE